MGKLLFAPREGLRGGAIWGGGLIGKRAVCKYQVSRESVSSTWLVGWESWYLPLPACFAKVRLLFVVLFINLGAETIFQLTNQTLVSLCFRVLPCQFSCFVPFWPASPSLSLLCTNFVPCMKTFNFFAELVNPFQHFYKNTLNVKSARYSIHRKYLLHKIVPKLYQVNCAKVKYSDYE